VFFLAYHLNWGRDEILSLPSEIRRWHVKRLMAQLEQEAEMVKRK
jgi:hypothetical protein